MQSTTQAPLPPAPPEAPGRDDTQESLSGLKDWSGSELTSSSDDEEDDELYRTASFATLSVGDVVPDDVKNKLKAVIKVYPDGFEVGELKRIFMVRYYGAHLGRRKANWMDQKY